MAKLLPCYNRTCGQSFDPDNNKEDVCVHHPGIPFFHDAYKGWTCCNKKSVDFTEFLNIKGCTLSVHSNIKPPEPEKSEKEIVEEPVKTIPAPIAKSTLVRPSFDSPLTKIDPIVNPSFKQQIDDLPKIKMAKVKTDVNAGEIQVGTVCKNGGCQCAYETADCDRSVCVYHPGVPIFHEGLKFWSCCQKRTSDFTAFMNQAGCESGKHKWMSAEDEAKLVRCRWDWHQTITNVVVTVYAKMYDYRTSHVKVNPVRLDVNLVFPEQENNAFEIDLELRGIVDVNKTKVNMFGSKVEITLVKAEPGTWANVNFPRVVEKIEDLKLEDTNIQNEDDAASDDSDVDLDDITPTRAKASITELS